MKGYHAVDLSNEQLRCFSWMLTRIFHGLILAVQILCALGFLFEFRFEGAIVAKCPLSPKLSQSRFRLPERQPESGASLEESVRSNA